MEDQYMMTILLKLTDFIHLNFQCYRHSIIIDLDVNILILIRTYYIKRQLVANTRTITPMIIISKMNLKCSH